MKKNLLFFFLMTVGITCFGQTWVNPTESPKNIKYHLDSVMKDQSAYTFFVSKNKNFKPNPGYENVSTNEEATALWVAFKEDGAEFAVRKKLNTNTFITTTILMFDENHTGKVVLQIADIKNNEVWEKYPIDVSKILASM